MKRLLKRQQDSERLTAQSIDALLVRPFAQHVRSDARAVDVSLVFDVHQLIEHLRWQNALQLVSADTRSAVNLHRRAGLRLFVSRHLLVTLITAAARVQCFF